MTAMRFQAIWTPSNSHLHHFCGIVNSTHLNVWEKITTLFHRIIESITRMICPTFILNKAKAKILPISRSTPEMLAIQRHDRGHAWQGHMVMSRTQKGEWDEMRKAYTAHPLQLQTPDGVVVNGFFYKRNVRDRDIPTIICFNPSAVSSATSIWDWLLLKGSRCSQKPFNVLVFDYPTQSLQCSRDLIIYGETLFQFGQSIGISEPNLHFLGYGFGGPIAASVAEMHPNAGRMVSLRAFASMESFIWNEADRSVQRPGEMPFYIKWLIAKLNHAIGWGLEATNAMWKLKNKTLFLYSRHDRTIPLHIDAIHAIGVNNIPRNQRVEMRPKKALRVGEDDHRYSPEFYNDLRKNLIVDRIVDFIVRQNILNYYQGDGFSAERQWDNKEQQQRPLYQRAILENEA